MNSMVKDEVNRPGNRHLSPIAVAKALMSAFRLVPRWPFLLFVILVLLHRQSWESVNAFLESRYRGENFLHMLLADYEPPLPLRLTWSVLGAAIWVLAIPFLASMVWTGRDSILGEMKRHLLFLLAVAALLHLTRWIPGLALIGYLKASGRFEVPNEVTSWLSFCERLLAQWTLLGVAMALWRRTCPKGRPCMPGIGLLVWPVLAILAVGEGLRSASQRLYTMAAANWHERVTTSLWDLGPPLSDMVVLLVLLWFLRCLAMVEGQQGRPPAPENGARPRIP